MSLHFFSVYFSNMSLSALIKSASFLPICTTCERVSGDEEIRSSAFGKRLQPERSLQPSTSTPIPRIRAFGSSLLPIIDSSAAALTSSFDISAIGAMHWCPLTAAGRRRMLLLAQPETTNELQLPQTPRWLRKMSVTFGRGGSCAHAQTSRDHLADASVFLSSPPRRLASYSGCCRRASRCLPVAPAPKLQTAKRHRNRAKLRVKPVLTVRLRDFRRSTFL